MAVCKEDSRKRFWAWLSMPGIQTRSPASIRGVTDTFPSFGIITFIISDFICSCAGPGDWHSLRPVKKQFAFSFHKMPRLNDALCSSFLKSLFLSPNLGKGVEKVASSERQPCFSRCSFSRARGSGEPTGSPTQRERTGEPCFCFQGKATAPKHLAPQKDETKIKGKHAGLLSCCAL
jgi:hypothetical protein